VRAGGAFRPGGGLGWCYGSFHLCTKRVRCHTKLPVCDPRQQVPRSNWTQHVNSSSLWVHCEPPRWMIGIHVFRTDWALTVLVSLQLTKSWRWRAWPLNASCNWVNLLQFSSVQFSSCAVNCPLENITTERSAVHESTDDLFSSSVSDKSHYFTI